jgi:hypothetical protein
MGSGFKTFTAGAVLTASDVNNYLMEQSIMYFATTGARDSALPSGVREDGMVVYVGSNDSSEGLYTYNGTEWRKGPGWNAPWGWVGNVFTPAAFNFNATLAYSAVFSPTLVQNRLYRFSITGYFSNGTVTGVIDTLGLYLNTGSVLVQNNLIKATQTTSSSEWGGTGTTYYTSTASGAVGFKLGATSTASATNQQFTTTNIIVEDIGANGAPV